eukprot:jgi/Bigna1/129443/aug1.9_g4151
MQKSGRPRYLLRGGEQEGFDLKSTQSNAIFSLRQRQTPNSLKIKNLYLKYPKYTEKLSGHTEFLFRDFFIKLCLKYSMAEIRIELPWSLRPESQLLLSLSDQFCNMFKGECGMAEQKGRAPLDTTPELKFAKAGGMHTPFFLTHQRLKWLENNCKLRNGDIVICTYPKCGTTWAEQIVLLLLNGGNTEMMDPESKNTYSRDQKFGKIWPLATLVDPDDLPNRPKSGEFRINITTEEFARMKGRREAPVSGPRRFPSQLTASGMAWGSWFDHNKGWWEEYRQNPKQVLWVTYEELHADTIKTLRKIANFLEIKEANDELLQIIANKSTLKSMKSQAFAKSTSGTKKEYVHMRKGKVGSWRSYFSAEMARDFYKIYKKEFSGSMFSGIQFDIGDGELI